MNEKKLQILGELWIGGNRVYSQNDEPVDAEDGSLWVDLDGNSVTGSDGDVRNPVLKVKNNGIWEEVAGGATNTPVDGGNADTLDGKHADEFALVEDVTNLGNLVGDVSVATQISTAIDASSALEVNLTITAVDETTGFPSAATADKTSTEVTEAMFAGRSVYYILLEMPNVCLLPSCTVEGIVYGQFESIFHSDNSITKKYEYSTSHSGNNFILRNMKAISNNDTATSTQNGLMESSDKVKLDGIEEGANKTVTVNSISDNFELTDVPNMNAFQEGFNNIVNSVPKNIENGIAETNIDYIKSGAIAALAMLNLDYSNDEGSIELANKGSSSRPVYFLNGAVEECDYTLGAVIDSLDSTSTTDSLSAAQGKVLKDLIDGNIIHTFNVTSSNGVIYKIDDLGELYNGKMIIIKPNITSDSIYPSLQYGTVRYTIHAMSLNNSFNGGRLPSPDWMKAGSMILLCFMNDRFIIFGLFEGCLPTVDSVDAGKFLRVSDSGVWEAATVASAEEASF